MEGLLFVPPDRGTLIGRAVWKSRYVVLGSPRQRQITAPSSSSSTQNRLQAARNGLISAPRPLEEEQSYANADNHVCLTIYKHKGDTEYIARYKVNTIQKCNIQTIQYRKPGPAVPTLVMLFDTDQTSDKSRKRRSSRTAGLSASNAFPNSLLFRSAQEEAFNIYDWEMAMQAFLKAESNQNSNDAPLSPMSPISNNFSNPFTGGYPKNTRPELPHTTSSGFSSIHTLPERQRNQQGSALISPSPSLRSRRSDLSSQASSVNRTNIQPSQVSYYIQNNSDTSSLASAMTGQDDQFVAGWTSAQGRSSVVPGHVRGTNSMSQTAPSPAPTMSILDRAFQMRMIPGSEKSNGEDVSQLSSIARFEALMRETDERIQAGKRQAKVIRASTVPSKNNAEFVDEDDDLERPVTSARSDGGYLESLRKPLAVDEMPAEAQRALEFIAGRTSSSSVSRPANHRSASSSQRQTRTHALSTPTLPRSTSDFITMSKTTSHSSRPQKSRPMSKSNSIKAFEDSGNTSTTPLSLKRRSSTSSRQQSLGEHAKRISNSNSSIAPYQGGESSTTSKGPTSDSEEEEEGDSDSNYEDGDDDYAVKAGKMKANGRGGLSQSRMSGIGRGNRGERVDELDHASDGMDESAQGVTKATRNRWRGSGFGASAFGVAE